MKIDNYFDWADGTSTFKLNKTVPRPYLSDMVEVKAVRGSRQLLYKTEFGGVDLELNFLVAKIMKNGITKPLPRTEAR